MSNVVKPFLHWAGGKSQIMDKILENLPKMDDINIYIEPFVGGGAVLFNMLEFNNIKNVYINDLNKRLINAYNMIKTYPDTLIKELKVREEIYNNLSMEGKKEYYYSLRQMLLITNDSWCTAVLFIFLNKTCFNGLYRENLSGDFNVPFGKHKILNLQLDRFPEISSKLQNVNILNKDFEFILDVADKNTFVYFDPPYRPINQTHHNYNKGGFSDSDQERLAKVFRELDKKGCKLLLSNSDPKNTNIEDNFFDDLYKGFDIVRISASRVINSKAEGRGKVTELLIKNYRS